MQACCFTGFRWDGTPKGHEDRIANSDAYVTGSNKERAIVLIHDGAGWKSNNSRLLADHFADEVDATVYVPDFFKDSPLSKFLGAPPKDSDKPFNLEHFIANNGEALGKFMGANNKDIRRPEVFAVAKWLKSKYKRLGAAGYCWGGWGCFQLGAKGQDLVDCISVAHPSLLTNEEIDNIGVPVQINAPEHDPVYTSELKSHSLESIPKTGVPFSYQLYPGQAHGFASRGDAKKPGEREAMILAKDSAVTWFKNFLVLE